MNRFDEAGGRMLQLPWEKNLTMVSERLWLLLTTGWRSDVTVHVQGVTMKAHRLILAMNSAVLEEKLFGQTETASNSDLILADDSPEAFYAVLEYMYGGCPSLVSVPLALRVSDLAVKYQMEDLHSACSLYIVHHMKNANYQVDSAGRLPSYRQVTSAGGSIMQGGGTAEGDQVLVEKEVPPHDY
ncbi:BTB/POZ domain-containing protein At1g21780-like [Penaeus chinensis]|uniref:BTB/POZ domain-containing protein At1g21780-like n=1 Tax=Penaeus chinensis TaxID=139456 RepID=UPI001FB701E3|nr:BTB/POZ domain-containing protein At1g21780-like [Penaeus chinensis]